MEQQAFETGSEVRSNNSECYDGDEVLHESHLQEVIAGGLNPSQDANQNQAHAFEETNEYQASYAGLLPMLQNLDQRLAAAISVAEQVFAARAAGDLYRGLAISPADVSAAFGRVPGETLLPISTQILELNTITQSLSLRRLLWLQRVFALTDLDLDVLLVALAPEIDLRYERLYAYIQDDVTRRRPSIDLALNILCSNAAEKLQQRERFAPDAPLVHHCLIEIFTDPHHQNSPLLAHFFRLDEQIVRFLLLDDSMDSRLVGICRMVNPIEYRNDNLLTGEMRQQLQAMVASQPPQSVIRLSFEGQLDCGQAEAVAWFASMLDLRVLEVDLDQLGAVVSGIADRMLQTIVREAWLRGALLRIKVTVTQVESTESSKINALWFALRDSNTPFVIESESRWVSGPDKPLGVVTLHFATPTIAQREYWWQQCLNQTAVAADDELISVLAQRYRLNFAQIQDAAITGSAAQRSAEYVKDKNVLLGNNNLFSSAKTQTRHLLAKLGQHIEPRHDWHDLVLPEDADIQLREICAQYIHRQQVLDGWGFGQKLSYGKGINVLFAGPTGTGKTMAAEIVANELGLDLYKIDLAGVVSKYIGETEKNLDRIFTAAEHANAVLFFDEADALFGKRTDVSDAHDRYANIEVSYLLQKMEQYDGLAILATNLRDNMDEAFIRRLAFSVYFPFPDQVQRLRIWRRIWPANTPLSDEVDLEFIAREIKVSGGSIKNIALSAAYLAAAQSSPIVMQHLIHAANREFDKLGRSLSIGQYHARPRVVTA